MKTSNLSTVFAAAQTRIARPADPLEPAALLAPPAPDVPTHESMLLKALRNSATGCDQIMQRRIGLLCDLENDAP